MMKCTLLFLLLICMTSMEDLQAQAGLRFQHTLSFNDFPDTRNEPSYSQGGMLAIDYRYGFKNYRLGLGIMPFARFIEPKGTFIVGAKDGAEVILDKVQALGANLTLTYYPLDAVKCDCPTINKKGLWFKQSLFLEPQVGYELRRYTTEPDDNIDKNDQFITAGIFAGLDFHWFSPLVISPMIGVRKHFELGRSKRLDIVSNPLALEAGIRIGWGVL